MKPEIRDQIVKALGLMEAALAVLEQAVKDTEVWICIEDPPLNEALFDIRDDVYHDVALIRELIEQP